MVSRRNLALACLAMAVAWGGGPNARADVKLPAVFSDHLVLQRNASVPVWGWAAPGEEVAVSVAGQTRTAKADAQGAWTVRLEKLTDPGPHTLTVKGKNTLTVNDVLVGEVWLGSGQSNMALQVSRAKDFEQERAAANLPRIRMFTVSRNPQREPATDCPGTWQVCSPETVGGFSAAAYFFGRELHRKLNVPVGLINSSYGGTDIAAWISLEAQQGVPQLKSTLEAAATGPAKAKASKAPAPGPAAKPAVSPVNQNQPAVLFNGMIAPLAPYAIRGALWYQGERNAKTSETGYLYRIQLPLLVADWRRRWGQGDFPFAWVQLPNFGRLGEGWVLVRESMLQSLSVPNTGMAVTVDIGEPNNIHPRNKQEVGRRLALWALGTVYGEKVATSGPLPAGCKVSGSEAVLSFTHTDGGLAAKGGELKGFTIAGADKKWVKADAKIVGETVVVSSPDVKQPAAVRYAWAENPDCNLYNGAGLPASPFRTDDWR